ncbi:MAG: 4-hydroxy-tetrahydrodipicolinate reductase [Myxococcota bacterium]
MPIRVTVTGATGRMGLRVISAVTATRGINVAAATERPRSPGLGKDAGALAGGAKLGVTVEEDLGLALRRRKTDVIIDFTLPEASVAHMQDAARAKVPIVIGTTGFEASHLKTIRALAKKIPAILSPNMSVAMNVMFRLAFAASKILGKEYDAEIVEIHHRMKKDAPSGTALRLGEEVARARGVDFGKVAVFERAGMTGERQDGAIGLQTLRGGDVVGEHTLVFAGTGERFEMTHRANSRDTFAYGAVRAAQWLVKQKKPGLYDMFDVLGMG